MDQAEIIARLREGDQAAYSMVVEQWQQMVYNVAIGIVQNEEDAEDVTQDVFVSLYEKIGDFREEAALSTWLYSVTIRKALDLEKSRKREKRGGLLQRMFSLKESEEPANFNHPGILLDNKEKAAVLFKALKKLPDNQRIVFTLHKLEGLSNRQIADVMGTSLMAVESLQSRAKANLQKILKDYYEQDL